VTGPRFIEFDDAIVTITLPGRAELTWERNAAGVGGPRWNCLMKPRMQRLVLGRAQSRVLGGAGSVVPCAGCTDGRKGIQRQPRARTRKEALLPRTRWPRKGGSPSQRGSGATALTTLAGTVRALLAIARATIIAPMSSWQGRRRDASRRSPLLPQAKRLASPQKRRVARQGTCQSRSTCF
jgi:hypothetical protein